MLQQLAVRLPWNMGPIDRQEEIDLNTGGRSKGSSNATKPGPALDVAAAMNMAFAINEGGGRLDPGDASGEISTEYQTYFIDVEK